MQDLGHAASSRHHGMLLSRIFEEMHFKICEAASTSSYQHDDRHEKEHKRNVDGLILRCSRETNHESLTW